MQPKSIRAQKSCVTYPLAVLAFGLVAGLMTGCSDSSTSSGGPSFERWSHGSAPPQIPIPPFIEPVTAVPGTTGTWGNEGPWYSLRPGGEYTLTWTGGAGPDARIDLLMAVNNQWKNAISWTTKNTGSYRLVLPYEQGVYGIRVTTYHSHPLCYTLAAYTTTNYYDCCKGAGIAYSYSTNHPYHTPYIDQTSSAALQFCLREGFGGCEVVDSNLCQNGAGGEEYSDSFWIESFISGGSQDIYKEIENSAANRIAAVSSGSNNTESTTASTAAATNLVAIGSEVNAADDKTISHLAQNGSDAGR